VSFAKRVGELKSSAIREILKITSRPEVISFAGGLPAPELFPLAEMETASRNVFAKYGHVALQYSITEGFVPLREKIVRTLAGAVEPPGPGNVLITQGSQQGLDLLSKLFIDKGSVIFTENPSYLGALQSFCIFEADVVPIASDKDGLIIDALLEGLRHRRPSLMYLMPSFQNPTGASLPMERRKKLIEIVKEHDLIVIEDDPYGELVFEGERYPSLFELGGMKNFIHLNSFSKTIAPGLRVAYLVAHEEITRKLTLIKQGTDLQTNTLGQFLVDEYLEGSDHRKHILTLRSTYRQRRDCMLSAMETHFPKTLRWNRPAGGMFLWVEFPEGTDARDILRKCLQQNVAFVPGQEFFPDGSGKNTMRLNFSNASPEKIEEGIRRMGEVLRDAGL
jgi:DNA-binding transcriptional MocR family regulator